MSELSKEQVDALVSAFPDAREDRGSQKLRERYVRAVAAIAPELVPDLTTKPVEHPLEKEIARGAAALPELAAMLEAESDPRRQTVIAGAIARVFEESAPHHLAVETLRAVLEKTRDAEVATVAAQALAIARDEWLLAVQRRLLASESASVVRLAARLIGTARDARSLPGLVALLHPERLSIAGALVWAIGRIGSTEPLAVLHGMLADRILVADVIGALEEIASVESIVPLLGVLSLGETEERERAARAVARIALANDNLEANGALRERAQTALAQVIDRDESRIARYYAIVAHARLGGRLTENRLFAALEAPLPDADLDSMSSYFAKRVKK